MRYYSKDYTEAAKRVRQLVAKRWPKKDILTKLREEGVGPPHGSKWTPKLVTELIELSRHLLDHDEAAAWLDELNAAQWQMRAWIDRLPQGVRDEARAAFYEVEKRLKVWGVKETSDLGDGESLRRLQPGDEHLYILDRIATPQPEEPTTPDPDDHAAWERRRIERAKRATDKAFN